MQESTIGASFFTKLIPEKHVKFEIWCVAGGGDSGGVECWQMRGFARTLRPGRGSLQGPSLRADSLPSPAPLRSISWFLAPFSFVTRPPPSPVCRRRDTAGQERYHSLAPMYYRGAASAVVVFDVTMPASYERAKKWVHELRQNVANPDLIIALVGNKVDLADQRAVPEADARNYAAESGLLYYDASAKANINVVQIFEDIADRLPRAAPAAPAQGIALDEAPAPAARRASCC